MTTVRSTPAPPDSGSDGDRDEVDRHLDGDGQTGEHPDRRDDRMENRDDPERRAVGAGLRAPQDDHGDVNQGVGHQNHDLRTAGSPPYYLFIAHWGLYLLTGGGRPALSVRRVSCSLSLSFLHPTHARHTTMSAVLRRYAAGPGDPCDPDRHRRVRSKTHGEPPKTAFSTGSTSGHGTYHDLRQLSESTRGSSSRRRSDGRHSRPARLGVATFGQDSTGGCGPGSRENVPGGQVTHCRPTLWTADSRSSTDRSSSVGPRRLIRRE